MKENKRDYGIDLLRILSTMMVLVLHVFSNGSAMYYLPFKSANYFIGWFLEAMCYCAVDIFALMTGYLMVDKKVEYWKFIQRWLQVWTVSVGITIIYAMLAGGGQISHKEWAMSFLPLTFSHWEYFTGYFGVTLLMPYINLAIKHMTAVQNNRLLLILAVMLPIWTTFSLQDPMNLLDGYSTIWIVILYVVGALIKKTGLAQKVTKRQAIIVYFACVTASWFSKAGCEAIFGEAFPRITAGDGFLMRYVSPTVIWSAIALVAFFCQIKTVHPEMIPAVRWMSRVSFGVFLIHTQEIIRTRFYAESFVGIVTLPTALFVAAIFGSTVLIYLICGGLDYLRQCLFDCLKVNQRAEYMYRQAKAVLIRWIKFVG